MVQIMSAMKKQNGHGDTSSDTAVSLKKGDLNTPPVFSFFKKKTAALISYFKAAIFDFAQICC